MQKLKCTISYDGTLFSGYQIQPNKRTVQAEIEKILQRMHKGRPIRIYSSGRTDAGVHARGQVFHFESDLSLSAASWKKAINAQLPADIYLHQVEQVPDHFHARFSALEKEYRYFVRLSDERDVFLRNYRYFTKQHFDESQLDAACQAFIGKHDFTAFSSARSTVKGDKIRTLYDLSFKRDGDDLIFTLRGDGFLYHMVRIIVAVVLEAGQGLLKPEAIQAMFEAKNRGKYGKTLPPQGLFLWKVLYPEEGE